MGEKKPRHNADTGRVAMADFVVKDSGKREDYGSGMRRDTQEGKPRYDLVVPEHMKENMLKRWAIHMTKGAEKYGLRNWELASSPEEMDRFRASAFRHFMQWIAGETDEDHAAAVYFNIQCYEYVKERLEADTKKCKHIQHENFAYICARCNNIVPKLEER